MAMEASTQNQICAAPMATQPCSPFFRPNLVLQNTARDLQSSLSSTREKWLRFLHLFLHENPVLRNFNSFRLDLKQIQCRNKNSLSFHGFAAVLPGDSVAGMVVANGIINFLSIYNTLLVVRLVLTWFPNTPPAIVSPLSTLCDPYLNIFRGIIPPLGGSLDLSPILAFLVLNAFTSTASAIPAELPEAGSPHGVHSSSNTMFTSLTTSQKKWMRRLFGNRSNSSSNGM